MEFDTSELFEQQNKERKREEARVAQMRQWDVSKDHWIYYLPLIYFIIASQMRFILAHFFNYQQLDPGRASERGFVMDYVFIYFSYFFLLGLPNKNHKTWKNFWRPVQYSIALAAYLLSTFLMYRSPPREFHEPQITQLYFLIALTVDLIIVFLYFANTYFLFRRKYLPDCKLIGRDMTNREAWLTYFVMMLICLIPTLFGAYIAPDLPKFFH